MMYFRQIATISCLTLFSTGCGKKGALIYPDMMVSAAPTSVTVRQSGSGVKIQFLLPDKDLAGRTLHDISGVKISRRANDATLKDVCRSCTTDYRLFRTLYLDLLPTDTQRYVNLLILHDSDVTPGNIYSYKIIPFTTYGVDGAASAAVDVNVSLPAPAPLLEIEQFPTEVKLKISSLPIINGQLLGYNLYRLSSKSLRYFQPINKNPFTGNEYIDTTLERGVKYHYTARALIISDTGSIAESAESEKVEGVLRDDE